MGVNPGVDSRNVARLIGENKNSYEKSIYSQLPKPFDRTTKIYWDIVDLNVKHVSDSRY